MCACVRAQLAARSSAQLEDRSLRRHGSPRQIPRRLCKLAKGVGRVQRKVLGLLLLVMAVDDSVGEEGLDGKALRILEPVDQSLKRVVVLVLDRKAHVKHVSDIGAVLGVSPVAVALCVLLEVDVHVRVGVATTREILVLVKGARRGLLASRDLQLVDLVVAEELGGIGLHHLALALGLGRLLDRRRRRRRRLLLGPTACRVALS